jgi:hypothetical protein
MSAGFNSLLQAFDEHARQMSHAQGKRFIEIRGPDGELHTCLIQLDCDPFDPATELANEIDLLRTLLQRVHHRHNAAPIINGIAHGLLGQRGYHFTQRLVEEGDLAAATLDEIRHAIWYDTAHPSRSPELTTIRQAAAKLLPALERHARRHGISCRPAPAHPDLVGRLRRVLCPLARRVGLRRWCLAAPEGQPA